MLADTVVGQLAAAGCQKYELIQFINLAMRNVMERAFINDHDAKNPEKDEKNPDILPICYATETLTRGYHRIHGARVTLDPLKIKDKGLLETWLADSEIQKTFSKNLLASLIRNMPAPKAWANQKHFVVRNENSNPIGLVNLFNIDRKCQQAEMAKLLGAPEARGKGYAKEAACTLLGYAFRQLRLKRIYLRTSGFNLYNIMLNEKIGFSFEGILRNSAIVGEKITDVVWMSMLAREYFHYYRLAPVARRQTPARVI